MKKITLLFTTLITVVAIQAQSTSFESSEGFALGNLDGQNGWTVFSATPNIPVVTNSQSTEGAYSIQLIGANGQGNSGGFSPLFTSNMDVIITVDMFVGSSATDNPSDVDFITQSPSQSLLTSRVKFAWDDTVQILDDTGTGTAFITTSESVIRDTWFELKTEYKFTTGEILYYIDGTLIYTGIVFGGTNIEQIITFFDNYESDGYFDNIVFQDGLNLSIENQNVSDNISLYPNPTNGDLNIMLSKDFGKVNVSIITVTGKTVINKSIEGIGNNVINTSALASGVYFAKMTSTSGNSTFKFIKN